MIRQFGFTENEYVRVRNWLLSAHDHALFDEADLLAKLRSECWHLVTSEHAACVLELYSYEGELTANVLLMGGEKGKSLREVMATHEILCQFLAGLGFRKLVATPRAGLHKILKAQGFEQEQKEFTKRLF